MTASMPKRKLSSSEKLSLTSDTLAREKLRNSHMVVVMIEDETDDQGESIVTIVR